MKVLETFEVDFKEVSFLCKCGEENNAVILVINGYGFDDVRCEKCGRRVMVEYNDDLVSVKS
ncbi:MAG: hypothetical protein JHC31_09585 [Sulfurihydrogenibium sp.]|jgi:DNA-directed RNA polymerase subunit RPC12/RpoP|nr:hypothetical protein [Sulfurihydrogenibium sp.]